MVLPRFAWRRLYQRRLVLLLTVVAMIWPLLCGIFIYLSNNLELLKGASNQFTQFIQVNGNFFMVFMYVQAGFAVFLAALAGPGLIAPDLANNALPLYFSRPLTRLEYACARLITLLGMLSIVTWIPGLVLFAMQVGMSEGSWFAANWNLGIGIVLGFTLWIVLVSLVALASSAFAKVRVVAGGLVLAFFFILSGASTMINGVFRGTWGHAISPIWVMRRIWYTLLSVDPPAGPGLAACVVMMLVFLLLLVFVLERKLRPVEVVS
jgi:ABC-2 type transport system permease protein